MKRVIGVLAGIIFAALLPDAALAGAFFQTNLTSDLPGVAANQDPNLVNPWGIAFTSTSPFWISDNGAGVATLYNGAGQSFPVGSPLVVTIPAAGTPTGVVFNGNASVFGGARFIFATEDGTISSWSGGTSATVNVPGSGAVYKGLALANNLLYAANFHAGTIDVFNGSFAPVTVPGGFLDPTLPAGYAPFDIQNIGGKLYVTYAQQDAGKTDPVSGSGHGFVDVFDANGVLQMRLISDGVLNSPWGLALAPSGFGDFGNDLLVGNFGDGTINAFDPLTGSFLGSLSDANGHPIVNEGLWALAFGNGAVGSSTNALYFTAGIPGPGNVEDHGLFGELQVRSTPTPGTFVLVGVGLVGSLALRALSRRRNAARRMS